MHSLKGEEKKTGQHIVQPLGSEIVVCQVMQENVWRNTCKHYILQSDWACMYIADPVSMHINLFSHWNTGNRSFRRTPFAVLLNESNLASVCPKHVFKENEKEKKLETSNRKVRI